MSTAIELKAHRYLVEGRVAVTHVTEDRAEFLVAGSDPEPYRVRCLAGLWSCACPAQITVCAHIFACQKITKIEPVRALLFDPAADDLTKLMNDALYERPAR